MPPVKKWVTPEIIPDENGWMQVPNRKREPTKTFKPTRKPASKPSSVKDQEKASSTRQPIEDDEIEAPKAVSEAVEQPTIDAGLDNAVELTINTVNSMTLEDVPELQKSDADDDDEDADEWITPENVNEFKSKALGVTPEALRKTSRLGVACTTADFAMQVKRRET